MNVVGAQTLLRKEVRRFLRVPGQTLASPLVSTFLYFAVFGVTLGSRGETIEGVSYLRFLVPGLIFLGVSNNAFLNSSTSLFITKLQGTVVDLLAAPMGPVELLFGFIVGAMARALLVGGVTWVVSWAFVGAQVAHPLVTLGFVLLTAWVFAALGVLAALWAEKFEQINFFPTFLMMPLTFLGGVFYPLRALPEPWRQVSHLNPVAHMVEGLRAGMLGLPSESPWLGGAILLGLAVGATALAARLVGTGYHLKT